MLLTRAAPEAANARTGSSAYVVHLLSTTALGFGVLATALGWQPSAALAACTGVADLVCDGATGPVGGALGVPGTVTFINGQTVRASCKTREGDSSRWRLDKAERRLAHAS